MNVAGNYRESKCKRHLDIVLGKMLQPNAATDLDKYMPYSRAANVQWGQVNWSNLKKMWFSQTDQRKYTLETGDLVVLEGGDVGRCAILHDVPSELGFQNSIHRVRAREGTDIRFVYYWMAHLKAFGYLDLVCSKATLAHFTSEKFAESPFPAVDLATQRQIADFLDRETARIDLLIEKKQRLVALLGEKARSVINQATTVGFRACETLDSDEKWLGAVAAHWRITPLKWFTHLQSGYAFKADRFGDVGTRLVRMNNLKRGKLDLEEAVCIADEDVNMSVMLRVGDILLGMSGSIGETGSLGNFAVVAEDDVPCLLNQRVGRFQFVGEDLRPEYLKLVIQSASFLDPIFLAATSTAQFNVSPSQVGAIMLALPPVSEQNQIVNEVARRNIGLNEARDRTFTSIDRLKEYRSALITAAVTGQIDVTTYAKSGTPDRQLDAIQEEMGA